jgi:hypothetical protein
MLREATSYNGCDFLPQALREYSVLIMIEHRRHVDSRLAVIVNCQEGKCLVLNIAFVPQRLGNTLQ